MLQAENTRTPSVRIGNAAFPSPFSSELEFNPPVRGTWNIVHIGMLIPDSHQIFVCARGCLRGVILTAAEMNAMDRMSWVSVSESDMFDGSLEENVIDGTADILDRMEQKPKVVLLFLSCIHFFAGCDFDLIIESLSKRYPSIKFVDCYMDPTMRKSGITPDARMRMNLYAPLSESKDKDNGVNIVGSEFGLLKSSELVKIIESAECFVREITSLDNYKDYLDMAKSKISISYLPAAFLGGKEMSCRLSQKHLHLPMSFSAETLTENYKSLCKELGIGLPDLSVFSVKAEKALADAKTAVGNTKIEIDYTAFPCPLGLARMLLEHGFNVTRIYADGFVGNEREDFDYLKSVFPELEICPTLDVSMRYAAKKNGEKILAIGQKAAYFCQTPYFVSISSGCGLYGFEGIAVLAELMKDAFLKEKDLKTVISHKGIGCESCL